MDRIDQYIREVCQRPILTQDEEADLVRRCIALKDTAAARQLVESHLRIAVGIARQYANNRPEELGELIQEGSLGILRAARKIDKCRGRFGAFARLEAKAAILKYMLDNAMPLALSALRRERRLFCALERARRERGELSADQIAELLKSEPETADDALPQMLDARQEDAGNESIASTEEQPVDAVAASQIRTRLHAIVELFEGKLTSREREIFRARWLTEKPSPLTELGRRYRLHFSTVSKIETRILTRLREFVKDKDLGELQAA